MACGGIIFGKKLDKVSRFVRFFSSFFGENFINIVKTKTAPKTLNGSQKICEFKVLFL